MIFSKLVAPAVAKVKVPVKDPLSLNWRVSIPAPPSSLVRSALARFGVPLDPVSINEITSLPAPISIESASFSLDELRVSFPSFRSIVQLPVNVDDLSILRFMVSVEELPTTERLADAEKPLNDVISLDPVLPPSYIYKTYSVAFQNVSALVSSV